MGQNKFPLLKKLAAGTVSKTWFSLFLGVKGSRASQVGAVLAAPPPTATASSGNDINLAPILFGVVIVFVVCNLMRVALNVYDFWDVDLIIECENKKAS